MTISNAAQEVQDYEPTDPSTAAQSVATEPVVVLDVPSLDGEKKCRTCHEVKALSEFYTNGTTRDGRQPTCKACTCAAQRARYANDPIFRTHRIKLVAESYARRRTAKKAKEQA